MRADSAGTIEIVCERSASEQRVPEVHSFVGKDEFGVLADGLEPNELITLFLERDGEERTFDS